LRFYDSIKREHLFVFLVLLSALVIFNSFDEQFQYTGLATGVANNYVTGDSFLDGIAKYFKNPFGGVVGGANPTFPCLSGSCVLITADDSYILYLNGNKIKEGSKWTGAEYVDITGKLIYGENLIAIKATDEGNDEGVLVEVWHDGRIVAKSDSTWKTYYADRPDNWNNRILLDESSWTDARNTREKDDKAQVTYGARKNIFSQDTTWMWNYRTEEGTRLFRKTFNINPNSEAGISAITGGGTYVRVTADDIYSLYINGELIGQGIEWRKGYVYDKRLNPGDLIAISAKDEGNDEGVLFEGYVDGRLVVKSDSTWKVKVLSREDGDGWRINAEYDDRGWRVPTENDQKELGDRPSGFTSANWIWDRITDDHNWYSFRKVVPSLVPSSGQGEKLNGVSCGDDNECQSNFCDSDPSYRGNDAPTICQTPSTEREGGTNSVIRITADDKFELYVNNVKVKSGKHWDRAYVHNLNLNNGDVIGVWAKDEGNDEGVLVEVWHDGRIVAKSDSTWKARLYSQVRGSDDWKLPGYDDDSSWEIPTEDSKKRQDQRPIQFTEAKWIWGQKTDSGTAYAFRKVISLSTEFVVPTEFGINIVSTLNVGGRATATISGGTPTYRVAPLSGSSTICRIVVPAPNAGGTAFVGGSTFTVEGVAAGTCMIRVTDNASPAKVKDISISIQQVQQTAYTTEIVAPSNLQARLSNNNVILSWNLGDVINTVTTGAVYENKITGNAGFFDSIANFFKNLFGIGTRGTALPQLVYDVWRKEGSGAYNVLEQSVPCSVTRDTCTYTDTTAQQGKTYTYKVGVRASTEAFSGTSVKFSNEASINIPAAGQPTYGVLDFNKDGRVDITVSGSDVSGTDGTLFTQHFETTTSSSNWDAAYDLNADGEVDSDDFLVLADLLASACSTINVDLCPTGRCEVVGGACIVKSDARVVEERPITITASSDTVEVGQSVTLTAASQTVTKFRWGLLNYNPSNPICTIVHHGTEDGGPYVNFGAPIRGKSPGTCQIAVSDDTSTDPRKYVAVYPLNVIAPISVVSAPATINVGQTSILTIAGGVTPYRAGILAEAGGSCELISPSTSPGNTFEVRALTVGTCRVGIIDSRGRTYDASVIIQTGTTTNEICDNNVDDDGDRVIDKLDKDCTGSYVNIASVVPPIRDVLIGTDIDFVCKVTLGGQSADLNNGLQYCINGKIAETNCNTKSILSNGVLFENCDVGNVAKANQTITCFVGSACNAPPNSALGNATLTERFNVVDVDFCEDGVIGDGLEIRNFDIDKSKYKIGDDIEIDVEVKSLLEARDVNVEVILYDLDDRDVVVDDEQSAEIRRSATEDFTFKLTIPGTVDEDNKYRAYVKVSEDRNEDEQCKLASESLNIEGEGCIDRDKDGSCRPADCNDSNANVYPTAAEICSDTIDNNCNGLVDNQDPDCSAACTTGQTRLCGVNIGECSGGTEACVNGRWSGQCQGAVSAKAEICKDGKDNDCDGLTDCSDSDCTSNVLCVSGQAVDIDFDGLEDEWERQFFGGLASGPEDDLDGDGYSNIKEFLGGSDPTNPDSTPPSLSTWVFVLILVIVIVLIAFAAYYLYFSKPKSPKLGAYNFKVSGSSTRNNRKLEEYIKSSLRKGFTKMQVRNALRAKGWTDEEVTNAFDKF